MRSWSRRVAVAAGAVVSLTAGACSSPPELDSAAVRELVESSIEQATGVAPTLVTCPRLPEIDDGDTFQCTATVDGQSLRVDGAVLDARNGVVQVDNADAVLFVELLEASIAFDLFEQLGLALTLDCGANELRVEAPGSSFECAASDASGDAAVVTVDVLDAGGDVAFRLG